MAVATLTDAEWASIVALASEQRLAPLLYAQLDQHNGAAAGRQLASLKTPIQPDDP